MKYKFNSIVALTGLCLVISFTGKAQLWASGGSGTTYNVSPIATKVGIGTPNPYTPLNVVGPIAAPSSGVYAGGAFSAGGIGTNVTLQVGVNYVSGSPY